MMELYKALNVQIANWSVLYTKLHRFHWYVKGPHFFTLHEKFEELYNEAAANVDEIAERLLTIGGQPIATMKEYLEVATISEEGNEKTANEMVQTVVNDYKAIKEQLLELAELADNNHDVITNDLAIGIIENIDKHIWMLSAYLEE